jgi:hypothetical protein
MEDNVDVFVILFVYFKVLSVVFEAISILAI